MGIAPFLADYRQHPEKYAADADRATAELRAALTAPPYDTADNQRAAAAVGFGEFASGGRKLGPIVMPSGISISSLLWCLESAEEIPAVVRKRFPTLQEEEWSAALRLAVVTLADLDLGVKECAEEEE